MERKVAAITGASSGFGLLSAIELAKSGFFVIATMRDVSKSDELFSFIKDNQFQNLIQIQQLDVTSSESIERFTASITEIGRLDVLVNNAGYAAAGFAEETPIEVYREQFETNFFGLISVTQSVLPLMRSQGSGKIINVSSVSGQIGFPSLSPYVSSKFAVEGFSESLRLELKPFGIDVVLIEPGSYKTKIWEKGKQLSVKASKENYPYKSYMGKIKRVIEANENQYDDPIEVARLIAYLALKKNVKKLRYPIGKGVKMTFIIKKFFPWQLWENLLFKKIGK